MTATLRIAILTETGRGVGLGHLRRCLALRAAATAIGARARLLVAGDVPAEFVSDARPVDLQPCGWIADLDAALAEIERPAADVVVVDSYAVGGDALARLGARVPCLVLIDDLADRATPVDAVVNGGFHAARLRYRGRPDTAYFLGPRYALLDPEFAETPSRAVVTPVRRVLVTLGGSPPAEMLATTVAAVQRALPDARIDVAVGPFTSDDGIAGDRVRIHHGLTSLRSLLVTADLAISAGGMTLYEGLATGTPIVGLAIAENQRPNLDSLSAAGLIAFAQSSSGAGGLTASAETASASTGGAASLEDVIARLAGDASLREAMSRRGREVVDGAGATRVARAIEMVVRARGVAERR